MSTNPYEKRYQQPGHHWSLKPSSTCERLLQYFPETEISGKTLIDLGCGEGRNAVYLASKGFRVFGIDIAPSGIAKAAQLAQDQGVSIAVSCGDISTSIFSEMYDVVFSTGSLHYIPPDRRTDRTAQFKAMTRPNGLHAISVLVAKPFIAPAPDADPGTTLFLSGELLSHYWDWEVLFSEESIFDCMSSGLAHRHCANRVIARKIA